VVKCKGQRVKGYFSVYPLPSILYPSSVILCTLHRILSPEPLILNPAYTSTDKAGTKGRIL
jgi:hypothetical protein